MRILIIGGTGFMGPYVAKGLHEAGHEVTLFHRGVTFNDMLPDGIDHMLHGDLNALSIHEDLIRAFRPDVTLHMMVTEGQHITKLQRVLEGGRIVMISSCDVYQVYAQLHGTEDGPPPDGPLTEDAPLRQTRYPYRQQAAHSEHPYYNYDKIPAEEAVMNHASLPGTVLRLPMVFGPGDKQHRLYNLIKRMDDDRPAIILQEDIAAWRACRGYVENMAHAIRLTVTEEAAAGRIYHVAMPHTPTVAEWAQLIADQVGWQGQILAVPRADLPEAMQEDYHPQFHWLLDTSRIREELGYNEIVPLDEGLQRTIAYERQNPPANDDTNYPLEDEVIAAQNL